ncbi:MAG: type-F conjugative transfer system secretin TraK [Betaproteobacteria bacterium AqS2]|uniref:Type-F conjugative transfer system secretin TraK n=1 Tax=Candidatus Amphirhobacter heronislandensis TaxID=1732024 RepID=A0A930UEP1_9GAMM|nr:type-F conjugative transfer system secretin TraK [Betaproteobacteria bacterium AqS2]
MLLRPLPLFLLLPLLAAAAAADLDAVVAADGAVVRVAADEPNLLEAAEGRVAAFVFAEGAFTQTIDAEAGVVYFRPLREQPRSGFVEVAYADGGRRRFALVIVPDPDQAARRVVLAAPAATAPAFAPAVSTGHVAALKEFLREFAALDPADLVPAADAAELAAGDIVLVPRGVLRRGGFVGERYRLLNHGATPYLIDEDDLVHGAGVLAVAAAEQAVPPQGATWVHVVRREAAE